MVYYDDKTLPTCSHILGTFGEKGCPGVEMQDIHEAYQLLLKIVKARIMFSEKLDSVRNKDRDLADIKEERENTRALNVNKAAKIFKSRKK